MALVTYANCNLQATIFMATIFMATIFMANETK